ncbi:retrovirus-related Pol polyprotein from transposon 297 [Trichonephila clavipes]|nr:retrovirus-related Pol polyprotein from transposon 297 [Trichonephila clavipes]
MTGSDRYDRVKQRIIDYHIEKMLQEGTIRPIQSTYASPVFLTRKNNSLPPDSPDAYRYAIDYRKLKSITKYPRYPLPVIDDLLTNIPHTGVLDESRSFFRVHTGYFSNIPKCIKAEFIASWACSQSSVVSSSKR